MYMFLVGRDEYDLGLHFYVRDTRGILSKDQGVYKFRSWEDFAADMRKLESGADCEDDDEDDGARPRVPEGLLMRIQKMMALALHEGTDTNEAEHALKRARKHMAKFGIAEHELHM